MDLDGRKILVVGMGASGRALAPFLVRLGAKVTVSDVRSEEELSGYVMTLRSLGVKLDLGGHSETHFTNSDLILLSPGVPVSIHPVEKAVSKGIPVLGEIEFASGFLKVPMIAVTGTNGKSTTVKLIAHLIRSGGMSAFECGNIGTPLIEYVSGEQRDDVVVVEVSSFQLETIENFHPRWAIVLNVSPDHLDRYRGMDDYAKAKKAIFKNQTPQDIAVLNHDDDRVRAMASCVPAEVLYFSRFEKILNGAFFKDNSIILRRNKTQEQHPVSLAGSRLKGAHNLENIMAALIVAQDLGIDIESMEKGLRTFSPLAHRVEFIKSINGVDFYDDSKGTNVGATAQALQGFESKVVLILGGRNKNSDFHYLTDSVKKSARAVIIVGEARETISRALKDVVETRMVDTFGEAVSEAFRFALPGDAVLLSPACASFDMFENYSHRGRVFQDLVNGLSNDI